MNKIDSLFMISTREAIKKNLPLDNLMFEQFLLSDEIHNMDILNIFRYVNIVNVNNNILIMLIDKFIKIIHPENIIDDDKKKKYNFLQRKNHKNDYDDDIDSSDDGDNDYSTNSDDSDNNDDIDDDLDNMTAADIIEKWNNIPAHKIKRVSVLCRINDPGYMQKKSDQISPKIRKFYTESIHMLLYKLIDCNYLDFIEYLVKYPELQHGINQNTRRKIFTKKSIENIIKYVEIQIDPLEIEFTTILKCVKNNMVDRQKIFQLVTANKVVLLLDSVTSRQIYDIDTEELRNDIIELYISEFLGKKMKEQLVIDKKVIFEFISLLSKDKIFAVLDRLCNNNILIEILKHQYRRPSINYSIGYGISKHLELMHYIFEWLNNKYDRIICVENHIDFLNFIKEISTHAAKIYNGSCSEYWERTFSKIKKDFPNVSIYL